MPYLMGASDFLRLRRQVLASPQGQLQAQTIALAAFEILSGMLMSSVHWLE
ncbi:hypothetical protein D9619_005114 [Psilocybe cf. subviscida]|uniref:Uncharacterized protein n=1 Tax=Psilocybe cf. subviscida TaxID=2480587 RepID=A0A8H5BQM1_9AGAR|nr:hypothetical protein D9619_005114 [Psilocybe cf. subviscida]